jgi:cytochrome o ubiquinol oxidase subunit IV
MSEQPHHPHSSAHGSARSYIVGFLLSLVFTAIPYYMVVNKTVSGSTLLAMILGVAVLQMIIQIVFFLHLGRGPKPLYNVAFFVSTVGIILVVVGGSIWIMNHLNYNMAPTEASKYLAEKEGIYQIDGEKTGACHGTHVNHKIIVSNGQASPAYTTADLCDTLTFLNEDDTVREITFGSHPQHGTYSGEDELTVSKERGKTITLNQEGTYQFHDHLDPRINGVFTVAPNR